jgi:hypothetical protein
VKPHSIQQIFKIALGEIATAVVTWGRDAVILRVELLCGVVTDAFFRLPGPEKFVVASEKETAVRTLQSADIQTHRPLAQAFIVRHGASFAELRSAGQTRRLPLRELPQKKAHSLYAEDDFAQPSTAKRCFQQQFLNGYRQSYCFGLVSGRPCHLPDLEACP